MSLDSKTAIASAMYSKTDMAQNASSIQVKRFSDANTSFIKEMQQTSDSKETNNNVEKESNKIETKDNKDIDKTKETEKTISKQNEKVSEKNTSNTDVKEESTTDNQSQNNFDFQNDNFGGQQGNSQQDIYSPLTSQIQAYMNANGVDINNFVSVNPMNAASREQLSGMVTSVDYSTVQMSDADAKFFADLVSKTDMTAGSIAAEFDKHIQNGNVKMVQSTAKASAALIEALKQSSQNHQAFRIDFDKDISVILQVDKGGKINANFIPGDKAVEAYLRNNIESLRQRFNEENIAYGDLSYSRSGRNKQDRERNNKENR